MWVFRCVAALAFVFFCEFQIQAHATEDMGVTSRYTAQIRTRCEDKWPDNYEMQDFCIRQQKKAWQDFNRLYERADGNPDIIAIFTRCADKWTDATGLDFSMLEFCSRRQIDAYRRLGH